eukprot:10418702-Lingulodinium_polyedra.AAC.1
MPGCCLHAAWVLLGCCYVSQCCLGAAYMLLGCCVGAAWSARTRDVQTAAAANNRFDRIFV